MSTLHPLYSRLCQELEPELAARGFTRHRDNPLWGALTQEGMVTRGLRFDADDDLGGWVEPYVGVRVDRVEMSVHGWIGTASQVFPVNHTLLVGATRWLEPRLGRQPIHSESDVLEVANAILRWWGVAGKVSDRAYGRTAIALDQLHNTHSDRADRYLRQPLNRTLRGLAFALWLRPTDVDQVYRFHRTRLQENGFWGAYGNRIDRWLAQQALPTV